MDYSSSATQFNGPFDFVLCSFVSIVTLFSFFSSLYKDSC